MEWVYLSFKVGFGVWVGREGGLDGWEGGHGMEGWEKGAGIDSVSASILGFLYFVISENRGKGVRCWVMLMLDIS
jgi:hypothetical protein